jgi:pimeloyl-ACP methyl ester carboxylesterase
MAPIEQRIRTAEAALCARYNLDVDESFVTLPSTGLRLRMISAGSGPDIILLHGVSLAAAIWLPWLSELAGCRSHLVELPGHGLSDPVGYRVGGVRAHAIGLLDDLFAVLDADRPLVVGHSLAGMYALWHAAARPGKIGSLVAIGDPAVALPGVRVKMPLSPMTVRWLGPAMLSTPSPRWLYRRLLGLGLSPEAAASMPAELIDVLRLSSRRKGNPGSVAALMHAIDGFRRARPESVMSEEELGQVRTPTLFCWGRNDPFLSPAQARPSVARIPGAVLHEVAGGHAPWLEDPAGCAALTREHLRIG